MHIGSSCEQEHLLYTCAIDINISNYNGMSSEAGYKISSIEAIIYLIKANVLTGVRRFMLHIIRFLIVDF